MPISLTDGFEYTAERLVYEQSDRVMAVNVCESGGCFRGRDLAAFHRGDDLTQRLAPGRPERIIGCRRMARCAGAGREGHSDDSRMVLENAGKEPVDLLV